MATVVDFNTLSEGSLISDGLIYVSSYKIAPYSNGTKTYVNGMATYQGKFMPFKIWDASLVSTFEDNDLTGHVVKIAGSVKSYKDALEINVQSVVYDKAQDDRSLFLKTLDVEKTFGMFTQFINENISQRGIQLLVTIFKSEDLFPRFKQEFAGSKMHDAQIGGLMWHTYKLLRHAQLCVELDDRLNTERRKDCWYIGLIFHDIGKVFELSFGEYTKNSYVTHNLLGIELLAKYRDLFIQTYDEEFYYMVQSIILGHHGEFGDKPRTAFAYASHLLDMVDSQVTGMLDKIDAGDVKKSGLGTSTIFENGGYIAIMSEE